MQKSLYLALFLLCTPLFTTAQSALESYLTSLERDADLRYAGLGFCALDLEQNTIIAQRNPNLALIPASSMKVVTTSTMLATYGKNYRFRTELQYDGQIENGILKGNIYIKGYGDPTLGSPKIGKSMYAILEDFSTEIQKLGIQRIEGRIIGDASYFETDASVSSWQWGDIGNHYGAGSFGLNFHDNVYTMNFQLSSSSRRGPKLTGTVPTMPYLDIQNELRTGGSGDNAYIFSAPYSKELYVRGTLPAGKHSFSIEGSIPDPAYFTAYMLGNALEQKGIAVAASPSSIRKIGSSGARKTFYTHRSPKLYDIIKRTNMRSVNMYCETFVRMLARKYKGVSRHPAGVDAIVDFWKGRGLRMQGFFMDDGSGLSARNFVTTKEMANIMRKIYVDKSSFPDFYETLPIAGESGTLKSIGRGTAAQGNVRAKSGSMRRIISYTGYATTRSGKKIAFCMISNNHACSNYSMRRKFATIMAAMASLP